MWVPTPLWLCAGPGAAEGSTQPKKARKRKEDADSDDDPWHKFGDQDLEAVPPMSPGTVSPLPVLSPMHRVPLQTYQRPYFVLELAVKP